jgi:hypothetical protein
MGPEQQYNPNQPPQVNDVMPPPNTGFSGANGAPVVSAPKKPPVLLIAGISVSVLTLITIILIVVLYANKKPAPKATQITQSQTNTTQNARPAQAFDVEQANNSIGQDISGANDDHDLPSNQLDDKTLGL